MKKLVQILPQVLTNLCVSFTAGILVFTAFDFPKETMRRAAVYEILLIDDPMHMHEHLEIYLKYIGGQ